MKLISLSIALVGLLVPVSPVLGQPIATQIDDDYRSGGARSIPDLGSTTGTVTLQDSELIDVIILGDGFRSSDQPLFEAEVAELYEELFGFGLPGIDPYPAFMDAFRVWSVFTESGDYVDETAGGTYYGLKVNCESDDPDNVRGLNDPTNDADDTVSAPLRSGIETAIGEIAFNNSSYPSDLNTTVPGDEAPILHNELAGMYRRMVVVMLVQAQCGTGSVELDTVFAFTRRIIVTDPASGELRWLNVSFGERRLHEFGHAFAYLEDEYIEPRGSWPGGHPDWPDRSNPDPADRSVFLLSNLTYSNDRCDLLWPHLAPGSTYNPDPRSYIGNLFVGGEQEQGVWHSEYKCLMNGQHKNYRCDISDTAPNVNLRDLDPPAGVGHLCFWCQELTALRILEKTGELDRLMDVPGDLNFQGEAWYTGWVDTYRDNYHRRFDTASRIRVKDRCYRGETGTPVEEACLQTDFDASDPSTLPACLGRCDIREVGNAIYVSSSGDATPDGSKADPYTGLPLATAVTCSPGHLVILRDDTRMSSLLDDPATIVTDRCTGGPTVKAP